MGEIEAPYGLDQATWAELRRLAEYLAQCLRERTEEEVVEAAGALREAARPLV